MAEQLRPCPFCGNTNPEIVSGDAICCCTEECWAQNGYDEWQKPRTPPPATKAMLERTKTILRVFGDFRGNSETIARIDEMKAFLAEWAEPATPPAPEQPEEASPWKCSICGAPVRIGDDLRPWHLDVRASHLAELSDEDLKFLADGLRLTD